VVGRGGGNIGQSNVYIVNETLISRMFDERATEPGPPPPSKNAGGASSN
jgi:hypothetical protein